MINASALMLPQRGQAMTEFIVSVAFVFMVLFVVVPTFGKIMDLQFQTQQASRYVAWERTIWFDRVDMSNDNQDDFVISNDEFESVATRSDEEVMSSLRNRFFLGHGSGLIKYVTENDVSISADPASPVWNYVQSKQSMYQGTVLVDDSLAEQQTPSIAYDVLTFVDDAIGVVQDPLSDFLSFLGNDNEDFLSLEGYDKGGYYSPTIVTSVNTGASMGGGNGVWDRAADGSMGSGIEDSIFQTWDGQLEARSAILADGWNTQSLDHYQERTDDLVLSSLFDFEIFNDIIDVIGVLEGGSADSSAIAKITFGAVGIEPMPAAGGQPLGVGCDDGFCTFDE